MDKHLWPDLTYVRSQAKKKWTCIGKSGTQGFNQFKKCMNNETKTDRVNLEGKLKLYGSSI